MDKLRECRQGRDLAVKPVAPAADGHRVFTDPTGRLDWRTADHRRLQFIGVLLATWLAGTPNTCRR
jgi:hypothetical protein